jgi:hypothetical protein
MTLRRDPQRALCFRVFAAGVDIEAADLTGERVGRRNSVRARGISVL